MRHIAETPKDVGRILKEEGYDLGAPGFWMLLGPRPSEVEMLVSNAITITEVVAIEPGDGPLAMRKALEEATTDGEPKVAFFAHTHNTLERGEPPIPCSHDVDMTIALVELCMMSRLIMVDHVLVGHDGATYSLASEGILLLCINQAQHNLSKFENMLGLLKPEGNDAEISTEDTASRATSLLPGKMKDSINRARAREGRPPLQI